MPRTPRRFVEAPELKELAVALYEKYEDLLEHVNVDDIYFAFCDNEQPKNSKPVMLGGAKSPLIRAVARKSYQIAFYHDTWATWSEARRNMTMLHALYSISPDGEGAYRKFDVTDYYPFAATLGLNWQKLDEFPDPLENDIHFRMPIPDEDVFEEADPEMAKEDKRRVADIVEDMERTRQAREQLDAAAEESDEEEDEE